MILHVTNGESAGGSLRRLFPADTVLCWNDVLHDGPVPPGLPLAELSEERARFIASCGWASYEDALAQFRHRDDLLARHCEFAGTVLWFEHDLYDQLQLIQILDRFDVPNSRLWLIQAGDYLGCMDLGRLSELWPLRRQVTHQQLAHAKAAWRAFRSPDPRALEPLLSPNEHLPYLPAALLRFCEEFPWTTDGLSRTQRAVAGLRARGLSGKDELFQAFSNAEDPRWMGDSSFFRILDGTAQPRRGWLWDAAGRRFVPAG
ncbi:MAG: DUF1835 domain-containing protein [Acidobacteria bacterium]|nr:DUF1835 domain-containing protein [Acidobacteriota bacterium]